MTEQEKKELIDREIQPYKDLIKAIQHFKSETKTENQVPHIENKLIELGNALEGELRYILKSYV
jgi:hypothetical protein